MCGIAGIILKQKVNFNLNQKIVAMTDALSHRGPDGEGFILAGDQTITPYFNTLKQNYNCADINYIPMSTNNKLSKSDVPFPTKSPINNTTLRMNGQWRFKDDSYLTQLQYFHKYNNIPLSGINVYPFCMYPNEYQPSGACNFSATNDAYFEMETDDGAYNVGIIARNYNLLRIMSGQAGLGFEL